MLELGLRLSLKHIVGALPSLRFTPSHRTTIMQPVKLLVFSWVALGWLGTARARRDTVANGGPRKAASCSMTGSVGWFCPMAASRNSHSLTIDSCLTLSVSQKHGDETWAKHHSQKIFINGQLPQRDGWMR